MQMPWSTQFRCPVAFSPLIWTMWSLSRFPQQSGLQDFSDFPCFLNTPHAWIHRDLDVSSRLLDKWWPQAIHGWSFCGSWCLSCTREWVRVTVPKFQPFSWALKDCKLKWHGNHYAGRDFKSQRWNSLETVNSQQILPWFLNTGLFSGSILLFMAEYLSSINFKW